jgi:uridine kinase
MKNLLLNPLFLAGCAIRLVLIAAFLPAAPVAWYVPFLNASIVHPSLDPWGTWLAQGGTPAAFPYGIVMWLFFVPAAAVCRLLGAPLLYGYGVGLAAADFGLLLTLRKLLPNRDQLLLAVYWLSPIVLLATYVLGFNDLVPVLLLALSLYCVRRLKFLVAGLLCVAAVSAKLSMVLALPFFGIYLFHNRPLRQLLPDFLKGAAAGAIVLGLPFLFSQAGLHMLFSNPEMGKIYFFALQIGGDTRIYVVPLVYLLMVYAAWRVRRLNFDMFQAILGMAFLLVVLLTPAAPGWFIWAMPLLVSYQASSGRVAIGLAGAFSLLYVVNCLMTIPVTVAGYGQIDSSILHLSEQANSRAMSLLHTALTAIGIVLAMRIWRETISLNDYFRLTRKPFVIGIAGDSGAGKDTFANALAGLFGDHSVTKLSGDDYHLWDRQKPMWQVMTHLNPMSNDLEGFANDLVSLADGKTIQSRHYDHETGKMSRPKPIRSNDFVIASGLHALYLPTLRKLYNLSIYLNIDEGLRRHFKIQRDVGQRGHKLDAVTAALLRREPDSARFIRPQEAHADLLLSLQPIHPRMLEDGGGAHPLRFKLLARSRDSLGELSLIRALVGVCGLHVDKLNEGEEGSHLVIEGETTAQDIALAARMLCPRTLEFLDIKPVWQDGILGLMQLITLSHINQVLTERFA